MVQSLLRFTRESLTKTLRHTHTHSFSHACTSQSLQTRLLEVLNCYSQPALSKDKYAGYCLSSIFGKDYFDLDDSSCVFHYVLEKFGKCLIYCYIISIQFTFQAFSSYDLRHIKQCSVTMRWRQNAPTEFSKSAYRRLLIANQRGG